MVPLAALITATLGSILGGLATPTEAAALGASGASSWRSPMASSTCATSAMPVIQPLPTASMVLFLAATSNVFGAVFARLGTATGSPIR